MKFEKITMDKEKAKGELKKYKSVIESKLKKEHKIIMRMYSAIARGKTLLSLSKSFSIAGLDEFQQPKIAIARADWSTVIFNKDWTNSTEVKFQERMWSRMPIIVDVPIFATATTKKIETSVPMVPPYLSPSDLTKYFVLWEVGEWKPMKQPKDPILLKPLTKDIYIVVAYWNLTLVERAVLDGLRKR